MISSILGFPRVIKAVVIENIDSISVTYPEEVYKISLCI